MPSTELTVDDSIIGLLRVPSPEALETLQHAQQRLTVSYVPHQKSGFIRLPDVTVGGVVEYFLAGHREQDVKERHGLIYADMQGRRLDERVLSVSALAYDLDGYDYATLLRQRHRYFSVSSTTFNHNKVVSKLAYSHVAAWQKARDLPEGAPLTDEQARAFLDEHSRGMRAHLTNARVLDGGQFREELAGKTRYYRIAHDPEPKCRTQFFLPEPILLSEVGQDGYRRLYCEIGTRMFGLRPNGSPCFDTACKNPGRIFWTPAHRPGATDFGIHAHDGELLDWRPIWDSLKSTVVEQRVVERKRAAQRLAQAPADLTEIAHVLAAIPPSIRRESWVSCLSAIFNETRGAEEGLTLAHEWSAGSSEQYSEEEVDDIWRWLAEPTERRKATMGTLVWHARQHKPNFRPLQRGLKTVRPAFNINY